MRSAIRNAPANDCLRVLLVITRGEAGGAQVHVHDLVRGLAGRVDFQLVVGDEGYLSQAVRALGVPVHLLPRMQREIDPVQDLPALRELRRIVASTGPHLVHTHSSKAGLLGRLAARLEQVASMHTAHSWAFSDGIPWRRKALAIPLEAVAARWTRRFVVVSEADREIGLRYRVARPTQLRVVHNGVPDSALRARPEAPGVPVITMVARLAEPKDHDLLLRALAGVQAPFRLRLVGDGPDRAQVEAQVDRLGLRGRVELLGLRQDVDALLADSQVFVLASRQEGFPLSILEGMRAGLPIVASDVGGVAEAVRDEERGFLIPRGDEEALRQALSRLLQDPALRARQGAAARRAYEEEFTVQRMLAGTLEVYRELAREQGAPVPEALAVGGPA